MAEKPFIVLVTRHKWQDTFTTQFEEFVYSYTTELARRLVRAMYPMEYVEFYEDGKHIGLVAHFTGEIFCLHGRRR